MSYFANDDRLGFGGARRRTERRSAVEELRRKKMTPEQEIERIKKDFKDQWPQLEHYPAIQRAIHDQDPVKLGEIASMLVHGYWWDAGRARRLSHPIVVLIDDVGLDFENIELARAYISNFRAKNPTATHINIFKRGLHGGGEVLQS